MVREYRVIYETDIEADSPIDAALQVEIILSSPTYRPFFTIHPHTDNGAIDTSERHDIDLDEDGTPPKDTNNDHDAGTMTTQQNTDCIGHTDHDAILAIQELLDGQEWTPETLERIAVILINVGYRVRDLNDVNL